MKLNLKISGMHCASCVKMIKMELEDQSGVSNVGVDFDSARASLEFEPGEISVEEIKNKIKSLGYGATKE